MRETKDMPAADPVAPATAPENWRAALPADLAGHPALARYKDVGALARAYRDLAAWQGRAIALPPEDDAAGWARVWDRLGRPKGAEGYGAPEFPAGMAMTPEQVQRLAAVAHRHGLSDKQFRGLFAELAGIVLQDQTGRAQNQRCAAMEARAGLENAWGPRFDGHAEIARRAMRALGFPESLAANPRLLERFHAAGVKLGEDAVVGRAASGTDLASADARRRIDGIRADGAHPFNDAQHPGHADAVSAMQKLYEAMMPAV